MESKLVRYYFLLAGVLAVLLGLVACQSASPSVSAPAYTVKTANNSSLGEYLVDSRGMTLYYFTVDRAGKSNATAQVIANWPIFYAANIIIPSNLNSSDFGTITGFNGKQQTTYKSWPLYYYYKDVAAGDVLGQGVGGVWFVVNPTTTPAAPSGS